MAARSAEIIKGTDFNDGTNVSRPPFVFDRGFLDKRRPQMMDFKSIPPFRRQIHFQHAYGQMYHQLPPPPPPLSNIYMGPRRRFVKPEEMGKKCLKNSIQDDKVVQQSANTVDKSQRELSCEQIDVNQAVSDAKEVKLPLKSQNAELSLEKKRNKQFVRCEAVRDDLSPPPEVKLDNDENEHEEEEEEEEVLESDENGDKIKPTPEHQFSKESSNEAYTDFTGTDLQQFLVHTLQNNVRERVHLLKIEQELINLIKDEDRESHKFPPMSSYHRMFVHRVAAFFGLDHNIDETGSSVVVIKQNGVTRIPDMRFKDQIKSTTLSLDEPKKSILKRGTASFDDFKQPMDRRANSLSSYSDLRKCKSFEEREEQYVKVRARIFNQKNTGEEYVESGTSSSSDQTFEDNLDLADFNSTENANLAEDESELKPEELNNVVGHNPQTCSSPSTVSTKNSSSTKDQLVANSNGSFKRNNIPYTNRSKNQDEGKENACRVSQNDRFRPSNYVKLPKKMLAKSQTASDVFYSQQSMAVNSLLPYPQDMSGACRGYSAPFVVPPYVDYSNAAWFTMPPSQTGGAQDALAQAAYTQPYMATNSDYFAPQHDNRLDKCKSQAFASSATYFPSYIPHEAPPMVANKNGTTFEKNPINCCNLQTQMASLCVNPSPPTYMMQPDQIGTSAISFYYLPPGYPPLTSTNTAGFNGNVSSEIMYSPNIASGYTPQALPSPQSAPVLVIPGISSSNALTGYSKPVLNAVSPVLSTTMSVPVDSYMKLNPYVKFPPMQSNTGSHMLTSVRAPICLVPNKAFRPQQSPLLPTPQQQNQNVPQSFLSTSTKLMDASTKLNGNSCNAFIHSNNRKNFSAATGSQQVQQTSPKTKRNENYKSDYLSPHFLRSDLTNGRSSKRNMLMQTSAKEPLNGGRLNKGRDALTHRIASSSEPVVPVEGVSG